MNKNHVIKLLLVGLSATSSITISKQEKLYKVAYSLQVPPEAIPECVQFVMWLITSIDIVIDRRMSN